ncbi:MAG: alpha-amylase/4-alpha-glucanotransferase domain-containing protein [Candidatus Hermodarchaeota archaeon]
MTDKKIFLGLCFHFHQPVDNFGWVIEDCFKKAYQPLIDKIYEYSDLKATLHFSGNLLEWFLENKPEFVEKLKEMSRRGQIEMIGGGYYEPIYALIPYRDKIAQMRRLSDLIKKNFGLEVKGAWLSERVWEPNYPSFLSDVGLKYVIVDDNHFRSTGITEKDTFYTYVTEDEGKTLRIFPINEKLRYLTPWKPTYQSIEYLQKMADEKGDRMALLISDAEKMGVWGSTHEICYVEGHGHWDGDNHKPFIPAFFEQILNNDWITSITLSEYMDRYPAHGLVYLPTASYDKMEEWVLPTEIRKNFKKIRKQLRDDENRKEEYQFLKGGFWRYYLVKYPESNNMHKKMLYVREKLIEMEYYLENLDDDERISIIKSKIELAWNEIYKAQCNDCYWHGLFGGIYLQFLRFSVYTHLINAEKIVDEIKPLIFPVKKSYITFIPIDFTKDSRLEVLIESDVLNVYINPFDGGSIFELDYKPKSYNLLNTLTRWPEAYHDSEKIETSDVMTDRYRKSMLRLRFIHDDVSLEKLHADTYYEFGDFVNSEFKAIKTQKDEKSAIVELERKGYIKDPNSETKISCLIVKRILIEDNKVLITVKGKIEEGQDNNVINRILNEIYLGVDIPFFFNGNSKEFTWESAQVEFATTKEKDLLEPFQFFGEYLKACDKTYDLSFELLLSCNTGKIKIYKFPIISYTYTDEGYKKIYQGINFLPQIKLNKNFELNLQLIIS